MRLPYYRLLTTPADKMQARLQTVDFIRQRGTAKVPPPPRDLQAQASSRGILVTWAMPDSDQNLISGWKIYKDDDNTLFASISDRGARQYLIPATAGSSPPTVNIFISSVNPLGLESNRVQIQGSSTAETGAPSVASAPPGFSDGNGSSTSGSIGNRTVGNQGFPQT